METKPAWIAIWLNLVLLLVTYRYAESTSTLSTNRRPVQTLELKLICTDSGQITSDVNFYKGGTLQGGCIPNCGSGISGYAINQDKSGGVTNLTIISVDVTRDAGNWTCLQVGSTDSKAVEIRQDLSNNIPPSSIVVKPSLTTTLTSLDGITNITASMPCAKLNPAYRWSYTQDSSKITVTGTDDSEQGACSTGEKIYSSTFLISTLQAADVSGTIVLQLEVEYDSFDPPTYTETFSSGNIVFGATTTPPATTLITSTGDVNTSTGQDVTTSTGDVTATTSHNNTTSGDNLTTDEVIMIVFGVVGGLVAVLVVVLVHKYCKKKVHSQDRKKQAMTTPAEPKRISSNL